MKISNMITDTLSAEEAEKGVYVDDLVKVVRCKDCKYWNSETDHCWNIGQFPNADWFCADGEKKE